MLSATLRASVNNHTVRESSLDINNRADANILTCVASVSVGGFVRFSLFDRAETNFHALTQQKTVNTPRKHLLRRLQIYWFSDYT